MKTWTISKRIVTGFAIIVAISAGMGLLAWNALRIMGGHADELAGDTVPGMAQSADVLQNLSDAHLALIRSVLTTNLDEKHACDAVMKQAGEDQVRQFGEIKKTCNTPEEKALFEKLKQTREAYVNVRTPIVQLSDAGKNAEAMAQLLAAGRTTYNAYESAAMEFNDFETRSATDAANTIQHNARSSRVMLGLTAAGEVVISVALGVLVVTGLNRTLRKASSALGEGAEQVASAAAQVSASSQTLAEGASEQAASLEETSSSLEEMSSMTRRNAENAQKANDLAKQAREAADQGVADMQAMNAAMAAIKDSSDDIAKIIKTIDEIAFQTNILALNAAVEAARAGEAGMGFAVVADEVRNLAQRSAQAAKETAGKIEGAISRTTQGVGISQKVAERLNEIVAKSRQVDELAAEVAGASREQTQGITQINAAVGQMDKVTQSNAASAEESAAAAEELNAQAEAMKHSVAELLRLVGGNQTKPAALSPYPAAEAFLEEQASPVQSRPAARAAARTASPFVAATDLPAARNGVAAGSNGSAPGWIAWDEPSMSTGVDSIDSQHRVLIQRINELHSACLAGTAREELLEMLAFLGEYARSHFKHEEGLMQEHKCPVRGKNKAAHVQFLKDYESLVEIVKRDGASTTAVIQLKEMLGNWLKNHICSVDTHLRNCSPAHRF